MSVDYRTAAPPFQWATASRPHPGETVSGDVYVVKPVPDGVLLAVIDGIGHGHEASAVSQLAKSVVLAEAEEPMVSIMERLNRALASTRGAVLGLVRLLFNEDKLEWLGIGNVEAAVIRGKTYPENVALISERGVVGHEMPSSLKMKEVHLGSGDVLLLATDGVQNDFVSSVFPKHAPQQIATAILDDFASGTDDALVLVARYLGRSP